MKLLHRSQLKPFAPLARLMLVSVLGIGAAFSQDAPRPFRAVCFDADAPKELARKAADAGLNTLIIRFDRFGGAEDTETLGLMRDWAQTAAELKMSYYPAIRALGPISALGITEMKWRHCKDIFGIVTPLVCPLDQDYWRNVVGGHVGAICRLAGEVRIHGVLLSLYRNWTAERHSFDSCFCDDCIERFFNPEDLDKNGGNDRNKKLSPAEKLSTMRQKLALARYHEREADRLAEIVTNTVHSIPGLPETLSIGLLDCGDTWFDRGVIRGLCRDNKPVIVGLDAMERACIADLVGTFRARWAHDKLRTNPVVYLDAGYFLPEEIAHEAALLTDRDIPFCLTHTRGWWRPEDNPFRVNVALGTADDYFQAIKTSPQGDRRPFFDRKQHALVPRVALVHGEKWSWAAATLAADMMKHADAYPDLFPAWGGKGLLTCLGYYDVVILTPGYDEADPEFLKSLLPKLEGYMRCGGAVCMLYANTPEKLDWLDKVSPAFSLRVDSGFGSDKGLPNSREPAVQGPIPLKDTPGDGTFLTGFEGKYVSLVGREKGGSYLLKKNVGKGLLVVTPNKTIPFELVANLWFQHRSRGQSLVVRIMSGTERFRVGENRLLVGVGDQQLKDSPFSIDAHIFSPQGRRVVSKTVECQAPSEGQEIPIDFAATSPGVCHLVVTVSDPESKTAIGRRIIPLDIPPALELSLGKNYYTTEETAEAQVRCNPVECLPDEIELALDGSARIPCERVKTDRDTAFFRVPLAAVSAGTHQLIARAGERTATGDLLKRDAKEGAVQILNGKAISCREKSFLPIGIYDLDPADGADFIKAGLTVSINKSHDCEKLRALGVGVICQPDDQKLQNADRFLAWQLCDEPAHNNLSAQDVVGRYTGLKEKDPYRPALIALLGDLSKDAFGEYLPGCDVFLVDSCPLPFFRIDSVGECVRAAVLTARGRRPIWVVNQCFDWRELLGVLKPNSPQAAPSALELRNMLYQAFANGADGSVFWAYRYVASRPELRAALAKLIGEFAKLSPILMNPDSRQRVMLRPAASPVVYRLFDREDKVYILACNPTREKQEFEWHLPSALGSAGLLGAEPEFVGSMLEGELGPLDAQVYVLAP